MSILDYVYPDTSEKGKNGYLTQQFSAGSKGHLEPCVLYAHGDIPYWWHCLLMTL